MAEDDVVFLMVGELRDMGVGAELDDATLANILKNNNNNMDQAIDAIFALSLQEEGAPPAGQPAQLRGTPPPQHAPQPQQHGEEQEAEEEEEEIDEMTAILLGLPWPPADKPKKPQRPPAAEPAHQAPPVQAAAFVPSYQENGNNGFGDQHGDGFQTVKRTQPSIGGGGGGGMVMPQVRMVVLVGPPGSGKSTAAEMFGGAGWFVVSQDALGSRQECEHACWAALEANQKVIVDRTNIDEFQRSHWVGIARKARVAENSIVCLSFSVPADVCKQRVMSRKGHRTLPATRSSMQVVDRFVSSFVPPREGEGFCKVVVVSESHDPRVFSLIEGRVP